MKKPNAAIRDANAALEVVVVYLFLILYNKMCFPLYKSMRNIFFISLFICSVYGWLAHLKKC